MNRHPGKIEKARHYLHTSGPYGDLPMLIAGRESLLLRPRDLDIVLQALMAADIKTAIEAMERAGRDR